jgi:hypothetical protein
LEKSNVDGGKEGQFEQEEMKEVKEENKKMPDFDINLENCKDQLSLPPPF